MIATSLPVDPQPHLHKLLLVLHVCAKYSSITGKSLPDEVDFFGKNLLGLTSLTRFSEALAQALRGVKIYIDVRLSC